jgi:drug/metabolite transporter (DMT)-like permease
MMILLLFLYALLALSFTIGKMLLFYVTPIFLIAIRMSIAGVVILGMHYFMSQHDAKANSFGIKSLADLKILVLLSFIHILIPYCSEFIALELIAPSCAALMFNLTPFFSAFFSYIYFNEKMTSKKWLGFLIGLFGIGYFLEPTAVSCAGLSSLYPYVLLLIAVISCALAWIYVRILIKDQGYNPMFINGFAMLLGGVLAFPISAALEGPLTLPWGNMNSFLMLLALIILVANIIFYNLYGFFLKKYTATLLSFVGFITPAFVALFDWLFLDISVSSGFFIATAILGFGIYIFYQEELKQGYVAQNS